MLSPRRVLLVGLLALTLLLPAAYGVSAVAATPVSNPAATPSIAAAHLPTVSPRYLGAIDPLPPSASAVGPSGPSPTLSQLGPSAASPEVLGGWDGLHFNLSNGWVPPDVIVSTGPTYVVEMVNLLMGVYTRSGTLVKFTALSTLFNSGGDFISDPKVQYDAGSGRWFATVTDVTSTQVLLVVSTSSDPTGTWRLYHVPTSATGECLDQPILGVGTTTVIVSVNVFTQTKTNPCTAPYIGAQYWVVNKNDLVTGAASPSIFASTPVATEFSIHPAQMEGSSSVHYLIATYWPGTLTSSSTLHLFTVSGTPPATVLATLTPLSMPTASVPPPAPQSGTKNTIDTGDIRVADAVWSAGALWLAFDEACPAATSLACIRVVEIDTASSSVVQDFDLGVSGKFVFYPALRIDGAGDLAIVFGYSSATDYPGIMTTGRVFGDPVNTVQAGRIATPGFGPENPGGCSTTCRYGDYFGAALDPSNASVVWLAGEMGTPTGWSTHIFPVSVKAQLTLAYRLADPGTGYSPPVVTYTHGGVAAQSNFSTTPTVILADPGTAWSVGAQLAGSSLAKGEVWIVNGSVGAPATSGVANASLSRTFDYFHQYAMTFGFRVVGGGAYGISPQLTGTAFGQTVYITTPESLFLDAGTPYAYPLDLSGSSGTERWRTPAPPAANVTAPLTLNVTYYHQVVMTFQFDVPGGSVHSPPQVRYSYFGGSLAATVNATVWADALAPYAYDAALAGATSGVRWGAASNGNGTVTSPATVTVVYREQYYVGVVSDPSSLGPSVSGSGWYNAGAYATLTATAPAGWQFAAWGGDASGSTPSITVPVVRPLNVTATFRAGLTITASDGGSVSYAYGSVSGTVPAGGSVTLFVPVGTSVSLTAAGSSWSQAFQGWSGAASGDQATTAVQVTGPTTVGANFGINLVTVGGVSLLVLVVLALLVVAVARRRRRRPPA